MKVVNVVLAIGTLIILGALITLGIKTFYPEPVAPTYPNTYPVVPTAQAPCASGDAACIQQSEQAALQNQAAMDQYNAEEQTYTDALQIYNRNAFIIANVVGLIIFIVGFFLVLYGGLASNGVPIGIMMAGLWGIIYGYGRGWNSVEDSWKFMVGLVVAVIVIGGSMWLMQKHAKRGHRA